MCCRVYKLWDDFRAKDLLLPVLVEVDKPALLLLLLIADKLVHAVLNWLKNTYYSFTVEFAYVVTARRLENSDELGKLTN